MEPPPTDVPEPDATLEPAGFTVDHDGDRIHFLDWGGPARPRASSAGAVTIHGLGQTAWAWTPVARRLGGPAGAIRFVAMDLRGHGLSDAPTEDGAYDLDLQADDVIAVAEGAGILASAKDRVVLAGHGFGAIVAARAARDLGDRCAGLVLVDGGWEDIESVSGVDVEEFLRELHEPPEVMRSMPAFLKDRREFDRSTWDADQEQAARATVVETHAGRVVPSARPHATEAAIRAMFRYDPLAILPSVDAPITALIAMDDDAGSRAQRLALVSQKRETAGSPPIRTVAFGNIGHNLMRYRPSDVAAAVLAVAEGP
jgi:pimeloyl-ACP methyl ester carboxylesterase